MEYKVFKTIFNKSNERELVSTLADRDEVGIVVEQIRLSADSKDKLKIEVEKDADLIGRTFIIKNKVAPDMVYRSRINEIFKSKKMTKQAFSDAIEIAYNNASDLLKREYLDLTNFSTIAKVAEVFDVKIEDLFEEEAKVKEEKELFEMNINLEKVFESGKQFRKTAVEKNIPTENFERKVLKFAELKNQDEIIDEIVKFASELETIPPAEIADSYKKSDFFKVINMFMLGFQMV